MICSSYLTFIFVFFFNDTATTEIYTLSLHDALPICLAGGIHPRVQRDLLPTLTAQHQKPRPLLLRERGCVRYPLREEPLRPLEHVLGEQCDGGGVRHGSER